MLNPIALLNIISNLYSRYYKCQSCSFQKPSTTLLYEILKSSCLMSTLSSQLKSFVRFFIVAICRIRFSLHILHYFSYQLSFSLQKMIRPMSKYIDKYDKHNTFSCMPQFNDKPPDLFDLFLQRSQVQS